MFRRGAESRVAWMRRFLLNHRHRPRECRAAYAAWNGFESPLRAREAVSSCASGEHRIVWTVEAEDMQRALALLPPFVAQRTEVNEVKEVPIP